MTFSFNSYISLQKKKKEGKKKSKLINGKLGFFLALHDSPFSQLFILLLTLQKLDGLPEAGLRRFMRMTRNPLKNHSNRECLKRNCVTFTKKFVVGTYILRFGTPPPKYSALF